MDGCAESHTSNTSSARGIELHSPTQSCCIKDMKHQPVTESGEEKKNCLNWRHVQISPSAFSIISHGLKHSEFAALSLSSSSSSWPLASYQPLVACGCKCEVWRFVKVRDSESVCLWDSRGGGDHCQLTGPFLLSLFKGFVKAAALSHPHWQKPALSPQIKLDP